MSHEAELNGDSVREPAVLRARVAALEQAQAERMRAESAGRDLEERYRKIFEHSNDAIFVIDPEADRILDVNPKACGMLGYPREELLSIPVSAVHPGEMPALLAFARSVFEKGSGWTNELTCQTKAAQTLPAEISASVIDMGGRTCLIALVRDISDRKRLEAALERYAAHLEAVVEERTARLRRSEEQRRVLLEINNAIVANLEREALFAALTEALRQVLAFDRASLTLYDPLRDVIRVYALAEGSAPEGLVPVGTEFPRQGSHLQSVLDEMRPLVRPDLEKELRVALEDRLLQEGIRSYVVVPLMAKGRAIGTLNVGSRVPDRYSEEDAEFLMRVATQVALAIENMLAYEEIGGLKARLQEENIYLQEEIKTDYNFEEIIGESGTLKKMLRAVESVAKTDATVLLLGETGTGKELIARAIHHLSPRMHRTLVKVNCAALPAGLIESELFGHEKGAFTGALARKIGRFELADGGTIFLDEIGDLPLELQAKLLRVLQEGEFERVGGSPSFKVNVRVIAATNRDLEKATQEGRFRPDLYYRLNVFPIRLPPLRQRREDIPLLVRYFVMKCGTKLGKRIETIPQKAMHALMAYPWPGNVREMENVIERAVILSQGSQLELGEWLPRFAGSGHGERLATLEALERDHIVRTLELTGWRVSGETGAAKLLGLKPTTLEARMKKLGIQRKR
ncbi:MAG: sigma 54-interacting transcriptional regulator [candidate division NC10 bacterium]|nr:sigma 54-interacting transcriptional regulator [candidate division NC10 bacterium]